MAHTHSLLLSLAGRVDDDLLATARELVAVGEEPQALEILVATLVADRTPLPAAVRAHVVALASGLEVDAEELAAAGEGRTHLFGAGPRTRLPELVAAAAPAGSTALVTWRNTPAGGAPGPVPHPVVLVELGEGSYAPEVVSYRLGAHLARAGFAASVEAYTPADELPEYQRAALAAAGVQRPSPLAREDGPATPPTGQLALDDGPDRPGRRRAPEPDGIAAPAPDSPVADHAAPDHAAPDHAAPDHAAPDHAAADGSGLAGTALDTGTLGDGDVLSDAGSLAGLLTHSPELTATPSGSGTRAVEATPPPPTTPSAAAESPGSSAGAGVGTPGTPPSIDAPQEPAPPAASGEFGPSPTHADPAASTPPEGSGPSPAHVDPAAARPGPFRTFQAHTDPAPEPFGSAPAHTDPAASTEAAPAPVGGPGESVATTESAPPAALGAPAGPAPSDSRPAAALGAPDEPAPAAAFGSPTAESPDDRPSAPDRPAPTDRPAPGPRPVLGAPVPAGEPPAGFRPLRPVPRPSPVARAESAPGLPAGGAAVRGREEPPTAPYGTERTRRSGPSLSVVPPVPGQEVSRGPRPAPVTRPTPVVASDAEPTPMHAWPVPAPAEDVDPPLLASMHDPLSGPLREPLLDAQLDRADTGPVTLATDDVADPSPAGASPASDDRPRAGEPGPLDDVAAPTGSPVDAPGDQAAPSVDSEPTGLAEPPARAPERSWTQDWASGAWAMPPRRGETPGSGASSASDDGDAVEATRPVPAASASGPNPTVDVVPEPEPVADGSADSAGSEAVRVESTDDTPADQAGADHSDPVVEPAADPAEEPTTALTPEVDPSVAADDAPTGRRAAVNGSPTVQALPGGRRRARHRPDDSGSGDPWGFTPEVTAGDDGLPPPRPVPRSIPRVRRAASGGDGAGGLFGPGDVPPARADGPFGTGPRPGNPEERPHRDRAGDESGTDGLDGMSRAFDAPPAEPPSSLSSREQELLRRLHRELAGREDHPDQRRNGS